MENNNKKKFYEKFIDKQRVSKFSKLDRKPYRLSFLLIRIFSILLVLSSLLFGYQWEGVLITFIVFDIIYALVLVGAFARLLFAQQRTHLFNKTSSIFLLFIPCLIVWISFCVLGAIFTKYDLVTQEFQNTYSLYFVLAFIPIDILVTRIPARGMNYPLKYVVTGEISDFDFKEDNSDTSIAKEDTVIDVNDTIKEQIEITKSSDINLDNYYAITKIRKRRSFASSFTNYASLSLFYVLATLLFGIYFTNKLGIAAFCIEMTILAFALFFAIKYLIFVLKYKIYVSKLLPFIYVSLFLLLIAGATLLGIFQDPLILVADIDSPVNSNGWMGLYTLLGIFIWFILLGIVSLRWLGFVNNTSSLKMMDEQESRKLLHNIFMNDPNVAKIEDNNVITVYTICLVIGAAFGILSAFNLLMLKTAADNGTVISCVIVASIMFALQCLIMIPVIKNEFKYKSFKNPFALILMFLLPYIGAGISVIVDLIVAPRSVFSLMAFVILEIGGLIFEYYACIRCFGKYQKTTKRKYKVSIKDKQTYIEEKDK